MPVITDRELDEITMHLREALKEARDSGNYEYVIEEIEAALDLLGVPSEQEE